MTTFKAGQLVTPNGVMSSNDLELFNIPGGAIDTDDVRIIGRLKPHDVALVVATSRGGNVYLLGPRGGGWTFGTFLKIVEGV